jgi:hypothetical protein
MFAKPFIVLIAKFLGPGPTRLKLVKMAHDLPVRSIVLAAPNGGYEEHDGDSVHPSERAA